MTKRQLLIYSCLTVVFVSIVALISANFISTKKYVQDSVLRETKELLSNFVAETNRFSYERIVELELISDYLPSLMGDRQELLLYLHRQNEKMPFFAGLGLIDENGVILASDGSEFKVQQEKSFRKAMSGEVAFSDVFRLRQDSTQKVIAISVPIYKDGKPVGVLSGVVNMSNIFGEIAKESHLPGAVFLLKNDEVFFSSTDEEKLTDLVPDFGQFLSMIHTQPSGSVDIDRRTAHFLSYEMTWNDWIVVVDSEMNPDRKQLDEALWQNGLVLFIAVSVVIVIVFYVNHIEREERNRMKRDLLTGLGNRIRLEEDIKTGLKSVKEKRISLFLISIDRFAELNERFGYHIGERVVYWVSRRLVGFIGKDQIYRIGEDQFAIVRQTNGTDESSFALQLMKLMNAPIDVGMEVPVWVSVSIGIRQGAEEDRAGEMIQDAAHANQEAQKAGGAQFICMTDELSEVCAHRRQVALLLETALERNELYIVYQPIYSVALNKIVSFESLMRWRSPVLGEVGPTEFIPYMEESDLIIPIGNWLIRKVAMQVVEWNGKGFDAFTITVNISVKQLLHHTFLHDVKSILKETGVDPTRIVFELTETVVVENIQTAKEVISTLNAMGIQTALDDFGTGYSSLSILKMLPFQFVKIDRAFVREMETDNGLSNTVLRGVIGIAEELGLGTIAEGVEKLEQLRSLEKLGAERIQGYFISKPLPPEEAIRTLEKTDWLP
ncbi:EAL domain-containing protein [Sporosarcina sp. Te-1]|uniref:bifunctional diguanylate cyclase/phosphodiesterase n=1 Tax=Sporosarcina sp. Te-1 TaxID=2818390 RepID=UPI001A9E8EB2|nr:EAL domain-containing protein [Sporosarcina sp. Te-1]QTD41478.1 EAL domain-containing protein [Sporosarcina sp. Te-1]